MSRLMVVRNAMKTVRHALVLMTTIALNAVKIINWQVDSVYQNVGIISFLMVKDVLHAIIHVLLAMEEQKINVNHACQENLCKRESVYGHAKKEHIKIPMVDSAWTVIVYVLHATDQETMNVQPVQAGNICTPVLVLPHALIIIMMKELFVGYVHYIVRGV